MFKDVGGLRSNHAASELVLMDEPEAGKTQRKADAADKSMVFSDPAKDPTIPAVGNSSSWGCQVVLADPRTELRAPQGR